MWFFIAVRNLFCQKSGQFWHCAICFLKKTLQRFVPPHTFVGKQQRYEYKFFGLYKVIACNNDVCFVVGTAYGTG